MAALHLGLQLVRAGQVQDPVRTFRQANIRRTTVADALKLSPRDVLVRDASKRRLVLAVARLRMPQKRSRHVIVQKVV